MGSENSKNDDQQKPQRNQTKKDVRLYTEDEIQRALENQKRMFEAKQLKMQTSSRIYPYLETQNLNTNSPSITANTVHSVTPSAPPENVLFSSGTTTVSRHTTQQTSPNEPQLPFQRFATSSAGPCHTAPSSAGPSHTFPISAGSSHASLSSARPSQVSPTSAGPSHAFPTTSGPSHASASARQSHASPSSAGSSHASLSSARPSQVSLTSAGPSHAFPTTSGPSDASASAGPLHASPSSAETSHVSPSAVGPYKRNHKQFQDPRTQSRTRRNQNRRSNSLVNCVTCNGQLSLHIYQCTNGHSSCDGCRFKGARCGNCAELITNMRNITLETTLADLTMNSEERIRCPNSKDGCSLQFNRTELEKHVEECPFNIIPCPLTELSEDCSWKGMIKQLVKHFDDAHPENREAYVDKEMNIFVMEVDYKVMHLVNIGFYKFLVHIQLDTSLNNIYMMIQYLGTNFGASKWTYELHVYNKKQPRRKFEYMDICKSNGNPISEIVESNNCAVINMDYAKTFLDNRKLTFKFYIKKKITTCN